MPSSVSCTIHAALVFLALWLTWPSCHATTFYYHKMTCYHGKYEFALQKAELCSTTLQQHEEQQQQQSSWFQSKWEQLTQVTSQDQESSDGGDSSSGNGVLSWFQTQWSNVKENFQQQEQQQQQQMGDSWEDGEQDTEQQASENQQQSQLTQVCSNDGDIFALGGILTSSQVLFPHFYEVKARLCHYHFNGTSLGCKFEKTIESGELSSFTRYGEVCGQIFAQHKYVNHSRLVLLHVHRHVDCSRSHFYFHFFSLFPRYRNDRVAAISFVPALESTPSITNNTWIVTVSHI